LIPNGARLEPATPERVSAVRRAYSLPEHGLVVGVGRLVPQKSWETLIDASRELRGVPIVVAGPGPLHSNLASRARAAGSDVRFLGPVDDVAALLACASCWVSTSTWEGLPLTLLETLSLGVPVVATAVDGVLDVISGDDAILVPVGDAHAVAAGISSVLDDAELAWQLSEAGRRVARAWSPDLMLQRYRDAYHAAFSGGGSVAAPAAML
jgi:glycosyltransferase involved in cell wall biosynthesis